MEWMKTYITLMDVEALVPAAKVGDDDIALCQGPNLGQDVIPERAIEACNGT